ncbi:hypothetical protein [Absidia glauca]|uniref:Helicase ATP-binding domain-containing protein n=1 Tax=Absidia glauca TaxID=4829 RepID=A0A163KB91_ABSGL|nr:hypothetical protein [Absidia glauca]
MDRSSNNTSNDTSQDSLYSGVDFGSHGDNEIVDLTTRHSSPGISTPAPSRHRSPNSLDTLVEDTLSEETLLALGIAIGEIRAQREIERRLEEEARQLEYAQQLQRQFSTELLDVTAGTPTASTTHVINLPSPPHVTMPPSPPQLQRTLAQTSSSANNNRGAIGAPNANSFGKRGSLPSNNESQSKRQRFNGPATAPTIGQHMIPSSSSSSAESSLENSNVAIPTITGHNSQRHPIEPLPTPPLPAATLPTPPLPAAPLLVQHLPKSRKEEGESMRKQAVEDLLSSHNGSTGNHHIDATQAPASSNLKVNLMEHQKTGYNWMCQKEDSDLKGGLLADDMGLGKTIQSLALITGRPCTDAPPPITRPYPYSEPPQIKSKATLIICPINLVSQWAHEIETKTENLAVYKHQGYRRLTNPYEIASYDVIVMPYSIVSNDLDPNTTVRPAGKTGCLTSITFHRVILDEAHVIKNWSTITARNCIRIKATYRWCLTASPVQARIDDMYGLFAFLKIQPYCDHNVFRQQILLPMSQGVSVADKIQSVMKIICLRRLKNA